MFEVRLTAEFATWLEGLRDINARARIVLRLRRFELGNLGDVKSVGEEVSEARIDYGPGYRLYFTRRGVAIIVLLIGGDKKTQTSDIRKAQQLAKEN